LWASFSAVCFYEGLTGAESCGCFGSVHVNPWITLFAVDMPAVLALAVFRPEIDLPKLTSAKAVILEMMGPMPSPVRLAAVFCVGLVLVAVSTAVLALNPAGATASYEVLEPQTWVGKELPILDYMDIGDKLSNGNWLVLFYHHDCPDCAEAGLPPEGGISAAYVVIPAAVGTRVVGVGVVLFLRKKLL